MIDIYELLRRNQDKTSEYVVSILEKLRIPYAIDSYGNIYNLNNESAPLLSAHMDTVRKEEDFCIGSFLTENDDDKIFSGGILGGDDKCGVYIILKALEAGKNINFIFSRDEEIGCLGIKALLKPNYRENKELADKVRKCLWCLVLDRRGNSDIICFNNNYGTIEFQKALEKISEDIGLDYKGASGLCSDANTIRDFVSTANISVGYFCPHSQKEYISKKDLQKAYDFTIAAIDNLKEHFDPAPYSYSSYGYSYSGYGYSYEDYYDNYGYGYYNKYYMGPASKYYQNKSKAENEHPKENDYDEINDLFEFDEKNDFLETDKQKKCTCGFCGFTDKKLHKFMMPDGTEFNICAFCFDDIQSEVKRLKPMFEDL